VLLLRRISIIGIAIRLLIVISLVVRKREEIIKKYFIRGRTED